MTPSEWEEAVAEVRALFGSSSKWSRADQAYPLVNRLDSALVVEAIHEMFMVGRTTAPSMSEVIANARARGGIVEPAPDPETCRHPSWGIDIYEDRREGRCNHCGAFKVGSHAEMPTLGELKALRKPIDLPPL